MIPFFRTPLFVREAVLNVVRRPFRSFLILQAIIWGSAAAVFPQALYQGSREAALTGTEAFASDRIVVSAPSGAVFEKWKQIDDLNDAVPEIRFITGVSAGKCGRNTLLGTDGGFIAARRHFLKEGGRNFTDDEMETGAPVCILEAQAAEDLFRGDDPVGRKVHLSEGRMCTVIGVLKPLPFSVLNTDVHGIQKDHALSFLSKIVLSEMGAVPPRMHWLSTERNILVPWRILKQKPRWLLMRANPEEIPGVLEEVEQYFVLAGKQVLLYSNPVLNTVLIPEIREMLALSRDVFIICLFMGIVVVANVMLISVNERRFEIAIRRCEGARIADIVAQFVVETGIFCTAGALIGIPAGIFLAWIRSSIDPSVLFSWAFPWDHAVITFVCVFTGGLIAGIPPAWRAAGLDPVEVLSNG